MILGHHHTHIQTHVHTRFEHINAEYNGRWWHILVFGYRLSQHILILIRIFIFISISNAQHTSIEYMFSPE